MAQVDFVNYFSILFWFFFFFNFFYFLCYSIILPLIYSILFVRNIFYIKKFLKVKNKFNFFQKYKVFISSIEDLILNLFFVKNIFINEYIKFF